MPTPQQVPDIIARVEQRIADGQKPLRVSGQNLDDTWLTVVVEPTGPGIRASEYAEFMSQVERELRADGFDEVVLVPALAA